MTQVRCQAVRWVADEPQPGWVEVQLTDADGVVWSFFDKPSVFDADDRLASDAAYPLEVGLDCEVVSRRTGENGRELVTISTGRPHGVETEAGRHQFDVVPGRLTG